MNSKFLSLISVLLMLTMILSLSGCNNNSLNPPSSTTSVVSGIEETSSENTDVNASSTGENDLENLNVKTQVSIYGENIFVNDVEISTDENSAVYLAKKIETHPDVTKEVENNVITITASGEYIFTGQGENMQILVNVDENITETTTLTLDNLDISCDTAPAILVQSAHETGADGMGSVVLQTAENSENIIRGSHTAKDEANGIDHKNDGAISTNVSMIISGKGNLNVEADNEGVESKMHLTFNGGSINIKSHDDAINASEDGVSHIIINDGNIIANSTLGQEGDGIDSNGSITINGGSVFAFGNETSMDSGLDSDLGVTINGGTVLATGNMYDEIKSSDKQEFIALSFAQSYKDRVTLADENNAGIFSFMSEYSFSTLVFSSPDLAKKAYTLYKGGKAEGRENNNLILNPTKFLSSVKLNGSVSVGGMGMGGGFGNDTPPTGGGGEKPIGERPTGNMPTNNSSSGEVSDIFDLSLGNVFANIQE